jgi:hypothetical protein
LGQEPKHRRAAARSEWYRRFNSVGRNGRFLRARDLMLVKIRVGGQGSRTLAFSGDIPAAITAFRQEPKIRDAAA